MNIADQARRYLDKVPPAISGAGGHNQTFFVACILVNGFGMSTSEALPLMREYSARCQPPWTEREIEHKLNDATRTEDPKGKGYMIRKSISYTYTGQTTAPPPEIPKSVECKSQKYEVPDELVMPEPMEDGARKLLLAAFEAGEGVRIAQARTGDDGRELPKDGGVVMTREEWIRRLDENGGNPNKIFRTPDRNGLYCSINPMKVGGSKDQDVTAFRHALVEFDGVSANEQWAIISQSSIPCTAVISSGGKSLHAWVRVDAKNREEYDERVKILYSHFDEHQRPDSKNKNPSRFSRLANCERGQRRQELLKLKIGCETWSDWLILKQGEELGPSRKFSELIHLDTSNDPNCVIGFRGEETLRYLCKGKSAWLLGPSGVGKSSLVAEFAVGWALGKPVFGVTPKGPLKSLIIQAENDDYDLAEMVQGVAKAYDLKVGTPEFEQVNRNVLFKAETTSIQQAFVGRFQRLIERDRPDIVWVDPLLSFAGIDVTKQDTCSMFLRAWLNPVLESTGAVLIGIHHTGKPKSIKETSTWTWLDYAYSGLGSSELVNWARAVMVLRVDGDAYELKMAKRGRRAGAKALDGGNTTSVWLKHSSHGIKWEQVEAPRNDEPEKEKPQERRSKTEKIASMNLYEVLSKCPPEGESARTIGERFHNWSRKHGETLGMTKCRSDLLDLLVMNGKLKCDDKTGLYFKGPNA